LAKGLVRCQGGICFIRDSPFIRCDKTTEVEVLQTVWSTSFHIMLIHCLIPINKHSHLLMV